MPTDPIPSMLHRERGDRPGSRDSEKLKDLKNESGLVPLILPQLYTRNRYIAPQGEVKKVKGKLINPRIPLFDILDVSGGILLTFRSGEKAADYLQEHPECSLRTRGLDNYKLRRSAKPLRHYYVVLLENGKEKQFTSKVQAHNYAFKNRLKYEKRMR